MPYSPLLIAYDVAVFSVLFLAARIAGRDRERTTRLLSMVVLLAAGATIWYDLARRLSGPPLVAGAAVQLAATALVVAHARRGRTSRLSIGAIALATGAAHAAAVAIAPPAPDLRTPLAALLYPAVLTLTLLGGLPQAHASRRAERLQLGAAVVAIALSAGSPPLHLPPLGPPAIRVRDDTSSVLLVVLDTARADHLSAYGYARRTTPHLDRWSEEARVFENVFATSSWTLPTHATMFTGLPARSHGAHGFRGSGRAVANAQALGPEHVTIAERARDAGARTAAVVANHLYLSPSFGLDRGFERYVCPLPWVGQRFPPADWLAHRLQPDRMRRIRWAYVRAPYVTDLAVRWLDRHGDRPFFLFVNYMDVHRPNLRPPTAEIPGEEETDPDGLGLNLLERFDAPIPASAMRHLVNNYDRELQVLDRELGRLLAHVERSGLGARTTVIVTSDHGEYLGEHGLYGHSRHLHDEVIRIPLLVHGPGIAPGRDPRPLASADLHAAIGERLGIARMTSFLSDEPAAARAIVSEWYLPTNDPILRTLSGGAFARDVLTVRKGRHTLFHYGDGRTELQVDGVSLDPAGARDVSAADLTAELEGWRETHAEAVAAPAVPLPATDAQRERIRALGYTSGSGD